MFCLLITGKTYIYTGDSFNTQMLLLQNELTQLLNINLISPGDANGAEH